MRTDQFLEGYNSCRYWLQSLLIKYPELQKNQELLDKAKYPYYETDGIDWHPDCEDCKNHQLDMDLDLVCIKKVDYNKIKDRCDKRELCISKELIERFNKYHSKPENGVWGTLHVVLADGNLKDFHINFCLEQAQKTNDQEAIELCNILLTMSLTQRNKIYNKIDQ